VRGKNLRLFFVVGERLRTYLAELSKREKALTATLNCEAAEHSSKALKLIEDSKQQKKAIKFYQKEYAELLVKSWAARLSSDQYVSQEYQMPRLFLYHNEVADNEFLNGLSHTLLQQCKELVESKVLLLCGGHVDKGGACLLLGSSDQIPKASKALLETMPELKGGGKGPRWQGKSTSWTKLGALERSFQVQKL
jgi:misacylated tRNA(Ala) deacylase